MSTEETQFWSEIREALLALVDIIERKMGMSKRTSQIRKEYKTAQRAEKLQQQT